MRRHTRLLVESLESRRLLAAVNIPTNINGNAGAVVAAPIQIDSASGVRAAEIRLSYDTDILNIDSNSIQAGTVWAANSDTQVTANVDDAAGTIVLFVTSANSLSNIAGSLAVLNFTIASGATTGDTATLNLTSVKLNEGTVTVAPAPAVGSDSTDGLITVSANSSGNGTISGFVFADANKNGTVDAGEAIAGVAIKLTNSTTGATQQTTSGSDGSYSFTNLAAAGYQLQETQPAAYFEGGVNTLTVQLTSAANLTNQNFVEGGLQPFAIYTRLRTTLVMPVGSSAWQSAIANVVQAVAAANTTPVAATSLATNSVAASSFASSPSLLSTQATTQATTNDASSTSSDSSLLPEGEYAPIIVHGNAAPMIEVEAREKQRIAAIEQALLDV